MITDPESPTQYSVVLDGAMDGKRLDRALTDAFPDLSRSRIKTLIIDGLVTSAGRSLTNPSQRVKSGMIIELAVPPSTPAIPEPENIPLHIVYEDSHLLVLDKPAGLVVHPAAGNETGTLVNALLAHCGDSLSGIGGVRRPGIVHRLDKDTSGLMVVAKTDAAHRGLAAQFEDRQLSRLYLAVVWGHPSPRDGTLTGTIGRHPKDRKKMAVVTHGGKHAITHYRTIERLGLHGAAICCKLETGRTHQIRVHLSTAGHPIIGDATYGGVDRRRLKRLPEQPCHQVEALNRPALHAKNLTFLHPISREKVSFSSEIPAEINELMEILRLC